MGFKDNFRAELAYSGMSIKEISSITGIKYRSLNNYLSKRGQVPSIETGVKIAHALGVAAEYLVLGEEQTNEPRIPAELRTIGRLAANLPDKKRKLVIDFLRILTKDEL